VEVAAGGWSWSLMMKMKSYFLKIENKYFKKNLLRENGFNNL